jgi:hypothetical protein
MCKFYTFPTITVKLSDTNTRVREREREERKEVQKRGDRIKIKST